MVAANFIMSIGIIILVTLLALGIVGYSIYYMWKKKKFTEFKIVIWEKDSTGNSHEYYDRGGIFLDKKTGMKLLFLEKMKKGLNPNNVPYVTSKDRKGRLVKTVYLRRVGVSNYVFCKVQINDDGILFTVGEEDVNWAAQDIETIRRTFNKESWFTKLAPYLVVVISMVIFLILMFAVLNKMSVVSDVGASMDHTAASLQSTATLLLNVSTQLKDIQETNVRPIVIGPK